MNEINRFKELILLALSNVDESYYITTYNNIENFKMAFYSRLGRIRGNNFERYGERVFCYEFYHQLRKLIDKEREINANFLNEAKLQAEVQKMQILELIKSFGLNLMKGEYAPDFLMHSPGNANSHPCVIEVKCEHDISARKVFSDLFKLNEFIIKYNYKCGIFLSINSNNQHINNVLEELKSKIQNLEGRGSIIVINKQGQNINQNIWQL
jgi:hypothetical protein